MSSKLSNLVEVTKDPQVLVYIYLSLGDDFLPRGHCFQQVVQRIREKALLRLSGQMEQWQRFQIARLQRKQQEMLEDRMDEMLLQVRERQLVAHLFQQSSLSLFIGKLAEESPAFVRQTMAKKEPMLRLIAILTAGKRHLHLEKELTECLNDPHPVVSKAAHLALVRVARGTDFGPIPGASQRGIDRSVEKWRQWLALQQDQSATIIAKNSAKSTRKVEPLEAVQLVLDHSDRELQTPPAEVTRLCDELVKAQGDEQMSVLARLRDAKGIDNTDALALAISRLSGDVQRQARDALALRLTRMTAATLRDKLQDDNVEVRRAAASACGRKGTKEHVPHLLQLLDDPEVAVIQAARRALKDVTGQDFGPDEGADRRARASAADAWRKWCKDHTGAPK